VRTQTGGAFGRAEQQGRLRQRLRLDRRRSQRRRLRNPGTGTPAWTGVAQATALAPTAVEAEALAKTALLLGPAEGAARLRAHGGLLVLDDGRIVAAGALDDLRQEAA